MALTHEWRKELDSLEEGKEERKWITVSMRSVNIAFCTRRSVYTSVIKWSNDEFAHRQQYSCVSFAIVISFGVFVLQTSHLRYIIRSNTSAIFFHQNYEWKCMTLQNGRIPFRRRCIQACSVGLFFPVKLHRKAFSLAILLP